MKRPLDDVLARWGSQQAPGEARLDELRHRVTGALGSRRLVELPEVARPRDRHRWRWALGGAAVAVAAMLVLYAIIAPSRRATADANDNSSPLARLSDAELRRSAALFRRMEEVFGDRIRWIDDDGGDVQLGIASDDGSASAPLLVRVVVLSRAAGSREWTLAWKRTLVTRCEERVDLAFDARSRMSIWAYPAGDGRIALDASLALAAPVPISSLCSELLNANAPKCVLEMKTGDVEYQVVEIVQDLSKKGLSS